MGSYDISASIQSLNAGQIFGIEEDKKIKSRQPDERKPVAYPDDPKTPFGWLLRGFGFK